MRRGHIHYFVFLFFISILFFSACSEKSPPPILHANPGTGSATNAGGICRCNPDPHLQDIVHSLNALVARLNAIIESGTLSLHQKHAVIAQAVADHVPGILTTVDQAMEDMEADAAMDPGSRFRSTVLTRTARQFLLTLLSESDYTGPDPSLPVQAAGTYEIELPMEVLDRYWMFYHFTEILGVYNNDRDYAHMYSPAGRESFIDAEVGRHGIEMFMDWWLVPISVWNDDALSLEQKLMSTKYTMWQNPHWGGEDHYVNEYWSWEAGFKDEDSALFTGNLMAALAAEYSMTRHPRTLRRLRNLVDSILYYDAFLLQGGHPLDIGQRDGRLQRGTKTKNLYPENEPFLLTVSFDEGGIHFHHNNSWPDMQTGRERKNVSRDQYYGVLTGYYTIHLLFNRMGDLTAGEAALLEDVEGHCRLIQDYLTLPPLRPENGLLYNLYALIEGSCANPPNLSFMGFAAFSGLQKITGQRIKFNDYGYCLLWSLFTLGSLTDSVELSRSLFEPAHSGLTAMNQYLCALFMSDLPRAHWEFIFPPELIREANSGRRKLWRRLIAAYAMKFGDFGNQDYRDVILEMLDPAENPPVTARTLYNRTARGYAVIEPAGVGIEDLMWPLMFACTTAQNAEELGRQLNQRYRELVDTGVIRFEDTDLDPD